MAELAFENETARIAIERNVVVAAWFQEPRVPLELREMERAGKKVSSKYKGKSALFNVILSGKPSFSEEVRNEVNRITSDDTLFTAATAHVILVEGFVGSAVRAFLATALVISRTKTPNKTFNEIDLAAKWVKERLEAEKMDGWTEADLVTFVKYTTARK
jgi:hypothetical protein